MNDFSVQPVKEHLLELAEIRLQNHPGMFQMLKHKLATGSPRALMILDCLVPGEWVYSLKVNRNFSSIDAKLIRAIDSWVNSRPTSKTVVVPLPAPYLPVGEPLAEVSEAPAHAPATVNQVQAEPPIDHTLLATPDQLIEAFGKFTGMSQEWFKRWDDKPGLKNANAYKGKKGNAPTPPLFYVFPVMQWLCSPKLKVKGSTPISQAAAWRRLKLKFPEVYSAFQDQEPDPMPGK